jgi:hypothetical protein
VKLHRNWNAVAKGVLRAEMSRRQVKSADLAEMLSSIGVEDSPKNVANKIARGTFSAAFLLQCLAAMEVQNLHLGED